MEKFREFIFKKKLGVIADYIDKHRDNPDFHIPYDLHMVKQKERDDLFAMMTNLFDFNKRPKVEKNEFKLEKFKVMYRGASKKTFHANLIAHDDRYFGTGDHGNGIYATDDRGISRYYTKGGEEPGDEMTFYLIGAQVGTERLIRRVGDYLKGKTPDYRPSYGKIVDFETGKPELLDFEYSAKRVQWLQEFISEIEDPELQKLFLNVICRDYGKMAMLLGYDAFVVYDGSAGNVVILNRNKITLTKTEFDRIYDDEERAKAKKVKKVRLFKPFKSKERGNE